MVRFTCIYASSADMENVFSMTLIRYKAVSRRGRVACVLREGDTGSKAFWLLVRDPERGKLS